MDFLLMGFKESKVKPQLKMACSRLQIASNKKTALMKQQMRSIATLLAEQPTPKEEKARIRAEALIREDNTVEAYELLQLQCELLFERIKLIATSKECPEDLVSCISTLMWSAPRVDIPELGEIRRQFRHKYGKEFEGRAVNNVGGVVNERIVAKLSVQPPSAYLVQTYLEKICDEFGVEWKPLVKLGAEDLSAPMVAPVGYTVQVAPGTGLAPPGVPPPSIGAASGLADLGGGGSTGKMQDLPSATAIPLPPSAPAGNLAAAAPPSLDLEEPDIFVPAAPRQGGGYNPGSGGSGASGDSNGEDGSDAGGQSYDDLAARFSQLEK